jgi:hypothetical protein
MSKSVRDRLRPSSEQVPPARDVERLFPLSTRFTLARRLRLSSPGFLPLACGHFLRPSVQSSASFEVVKGATFVRLTTSRAHIARGYREEGTSSGYAGERLRALPSQTRFCSWTDVKQNPWDVGESARCALSGFADIACATRMRCSPARSAG